MRNKKWLAYALISAFCLGMVASTIGCGTENSKKTETSIETEEKEAALSDETSTSDEVVESVCTDYPACVYVDGVIYFATATECQMVPRRAADGEIKTFVEGEMPDSPDSANFGKEYGSMEYMLLEDGTLIVKQGDVWYVCVKE